MPSVTTTATPLSSSGSKDGLSERERVLLKKFGGDLPLPSRKQQQDDPQNSLNGINNDWPGVVLGGTGGDLDGGVGGGVALAVNRSTDTANGGSSQGGKKKEKVDAGIAPWLSADPGGDFGVSTISYLVESRRSPRKEGRIYGEAKEGRRKRRKEASSSHSCPPPPSVELNKYPFSVKSSSSLTLLYSFLFSHCLHQAPEPISPTSRPTARPTQPPLNHSPSAPHLSGYSPPGGSPSNSNHNSFSRARQTTVQAMSITAPDKRRPGSKEGVERSGGGGSQKAPGPLVPSPANGGEDKRKKSGFLGGLGLIKRKATKSKEESESFQ